MMKSVFAMLAMVMFVAGGVCSAAENPYKKAKVGDWVSYVQTTTAMNMSAPGHSYGKQTVKAKDDKVVTILIEVESDGQKSNREIKIPLDQPYDPQTAGMPKDMNAKVEKLADGSETITVSGRTFACQWTQVRIFVEGEQIGMTVSKMWVCPNVPLGGMVKMESDMSLKTGGNTMKVHLQTEITDFGRGQ